MMTFDLNNTNDRRAFAQLIAEFQGYGVEYRLSYEDGHAYVTPTGARK